MKSKKSLRTRYRRLVRRHPIVLGLLPWVLSIAVIASFVLLILTWKNEYSITFSIPEKQYVQVECGEAVSLDEVTAVWQGTIFHKNPIPVPVREDGIYSTQLPGTYIVTYTAEYEKQSGTAERIIQVADTKEPVLTLNQPGITVLSLGSTYSEPGYTAQDVCDGDLTDHVIVSGTVDTGSAGTYQLYYSVTDAAGNLAETVREIQITDEEAPIIRIEGDAEVRVAAGSSYTEPGYSAYDNADGDLTASVLVSSDVDTGTPGNYEIIYSVTDSSGNISEVTRTVVVYEAPPQEQELVASGEKIIYLTFDDGPGPYTQQLLDVLDKYGVKATFFVTLAEPNYFYLIGEEAARGHTIAIHSATHDYDTIYASEEAFYADLNQVNEVIYQQTGSYSHFLRFPGGSSNMVSAYNPGIMSRLAASLTSQGYRYFDWNVSSGDGASNPLTMEQVYVNVTGNVIKQNVSFVLQHDTKDYSVEAVEWIIIWAMQNGYTFLPITDETVPVHHTILN